MARVMARIRVRIRLRIRVWVRVRVDSNNCCTFVDSKNLGHPKGELVAVENQLHPELEVATPTPRVRVRI